MGGAGINPTLVANFGDLRIVNSYTLWYCYTMHGKKLVLQLAPMREFRRELAYLYAKRSSVDELIRSLREYERYQSKREGQYPRRRTA